MEKSVFKVFFSKHKERLWLDSCGANGWRLKKMRDSKYVFDVIDGHKYTYSIDNLGVSCKSEQAEEYFRELSIQGIEPVVTKGQWAYLVRADGKITHKRTQYNENSKPFLTKAIYLFAFSLVMCIICGYQFYAIDLLKSVGYDSSADVIKSLTTEDGNFFVLMLNALKGILNFFISVLNGYFGLWMDIIGSQSHAVAVISISMPAAIILAVIGSLNLDEFVRFREAAKSTPVIASNTPAKVGKRRVSG